MFPTLNWDPNINVERRNDAKVSAAKVHGAVNCANDDAAERTLNSLETSAAQSSSSARASQTERRTIRVSTTSIGSIAIVGSSRCW